MNAAVTDRRVWWQRCQKVLKSRSHPGHEAWTLVVGRRTVCLCFESVVALGSSLTRVLVNQLLALELNSLHLVVERRDLFFKALVSWPLLSSFMNCIDTYSLC